MSATIEQVHTNDTNTKPLWVAVGALGATVLAMGATLVYLQARPDPRVPTLPTVAAMQTEIAAPVNPALNQAVSKQDEAEKPAVAHISKSPVAPKYIASRNHKANSAGHTSSPSSPSSPGTVGQTPAPVIASGYPAVVTDQSVVVAQSAPAVVQSAPQVVMRPLCGNCGTVESATPVQREGSGTGLGAVAGGVLGAVMGSQVGGGNGRTAATVLGALGGGWAGNTVEKKMKKETLYQVRVHMEDGSTRTLELASPFGAGTRVTVEGNSLRLADGSQASPVTAAPHRQTQFNPGPVQTGG